MEEQIENRVMMVQYFRLENVLILMRVKRNRLAFILLAADSLTIRELNRRVRQLILPFCLEFLLLPHQQFIKYQQSLPFGDLYTTIHTYYTLLISCVTKILILFPMIKNLSSQVGQTPEFVCLLCYQEFNGTDRQPMEVCQHRHSCCLHCLESQVFKNIQENHSASCGQCHSAIKKTEARRFQLLEELKTTANHLKNGAHRPHVAEHEDVEKLKEELKKERNKNEWLVQQYVSLEKLHQTFSHQYERKSKKYQKNVEKFSRLAWESNGEKLFQEGKYKEAIELSQDVIKACPGIQYDIVGLGNVEDRAGVSESFVTTWSQQHSKQISNPYDVLCYSFSQLENYEQAERWYSYRLGKDKDNFRIIFGLANVFYNQGKYDQAEKLYLRVTELNQHFEKSFRMLAFIKTVKENNKEEGKKWAALAKAKNSESFYADYLLAISEDTPDAQIEKLTQLHETVFKNYPRVYNALGFSFKVKKELDEAIKFFKKSIESHPSYEVPYYNLALIYQERGQHDQAANYFEESIKLNKNYVNAYLGLGNLFTSRKGEEDKAISWYGQCLAVSPNNIAAYNGLGKVHAIKEQYDEAINSFKKCIELNEKHELSYNSLGNVYFYREDYDEAIKWYQKCIELNPNYLGPYNGLCNVYGKKGEEDEARKWFEKRQAIKSAHS